MRVRGHSEADKVSYVPKALLQEWARLDPIPQFEQQLRTGGVLGGEADEAMRARIAQEVEDGLAWAEASPEPDPATVAHGVYAEE
jgi:TPP-dependent pyruvate/acetoin dehydrogenase alpha subunit